MAARHAPGRTLETCGDTGPRQMNALNDITRLTVRLACLAIYIRLFGPYVRKGVFFLQALC